MSDPTFTKNDIFAFSFIPSPIDHFYEVLFSIWTSVALTCQIQLSLLIDFSMFLTLSLAFVLITSSCATPLTLATI